MKNKTLHSGSGLLLAAVLTMAVIVLANASLTSLRIDLTENRLFTLSDGTINIIQSLEEPVQIDFYFSRETLLGFPALLNYGNRVRDLLEEYAAKSGGNIELNIIEPEPFSEEEDQAVASGLQGVSINTAGDRAYFGLVGTNSTDDESNIPFFQDSREAALEYDITKLIFNLANPEKRVIGIISTLPVFGEAQPGLPPSPWAIIGVMQEFFDVRNLGKGVGTISDEIDVLMVIHPKDLDDSTLFAIDQFILSGGNALFFVDPLAETDRTQPDPNNPMVMPDMDSDLKVFLDGWGIEIVDSKLAADITSAMRVQTRGARGPQETLYLPWLRLGEESFNSNDFTTSELKVIHMGTAGIIEQKEDSGVELSRLIETSVDSMQLERDLILFQQDPNVILDNFESENRKQLLAARISGRVKSAFPEGNPVAGDGNAESIGEGDINVILVSDTDILADIFWVRTQSFFGVDIPEPIANNGDFVVNTLENLSGNTDLISLRSRGEFSRPFEVVEDIRREAEDKFRDRERELQTKLAETEQRILSLQRDTGESGLILSKEQSAEIEKFQAEQIKTRKELRAVQHELQKNIESLGSKLKFINIGLIPFIIMLIAIFAGVYRSRSH